MTTRLRSVFAVGLVAAGVTLATTYSLKAAPQAALPQDPMTALLAEVHALRIAMEQTATVAPRVQLTLARLNIEEQRIAQLAAQLDSVRRELSAASLESQKLADQLPDVEKGLLSPDDKTRTSYEYEQRSLKQRLAAHSRLEQHLRARENDAAQALRTEQTRWIDLNTRLDELERLLAPVPR